MRSMPKELSRAIRFSSFYHAGQLDRGGRPYILHPLWVMRKVAYLGDDYAILGVCHDVVEDHFKGCFEQGFDEFRKSVTDDEELLIDLRVLTHKPEDPYARYIAGIRPRERARAVKKKDLEHNSSILRLKGLSQKDLDRAKKYHASYCYLDWQDDKLLELAGV